MDLQIRHRPPPTGRGSHTGELVAVGPDGQPRGALWYEAGEGRWTVDLDGSAAPEVLAALMDACVAEAERCDAWLVAGSESAGRLLADPRWHDFEEATLPRTVSVKAVAVPPALARFCKRVAAALRAGAAQPSRARDPERKAISTELGEAILGFSAEDAQLTWRPTGRPGVPGWDPLVSWTFTAGPERLQAIAQGAVATLEVEEAVVAPSEAAQLQDLARLIDDWVADEVLRVKGDPVGAARTRAVRAIARRHLAWFARAWPLAAGPERRAALAELSSALLEDELVEDLCAEDGELLRELERRFWGRGR